MQSQRQPTSRSNPILEHFNDEITKMEETKTQLLKRYKEIFKICEINSDKEDFDFEGDDDMLDINFAGKIVRNIKRSTLTKPRNGRSLFTCLFRKQWDVFHPRDKEGRIYIDMEEEWISPLLDYMMYYQVPVDCLYVKNSIDFPFSKVFSFFHLSSLFSDEPFYPSADPTSNIYSLVGSDVHACAGFSYSDYKCHLTGQFLQRGYKYSELRKLGVHQKLGNHTTGKKEDIDLSFYRKQNLRGIELLMCIVFTPEKPKTDGHLFLTSTSCCLYPPSSGSTTSTCLSDKLGFKCGSKVCYSYNVIKGDPSKNIQISPKISEKFLNVIASMNNEDTEHTNSRFFPIVYLKKLNDDTNNHDYVVALILKENGEIYDHSVDGIEIESCCHTVEIYEVNHYKMNRILKELSISQENFILKKEMTEKTTTNEFYEKTFEKVNEFLQNYSLETKILNSMDEEFIFIKQYFCLVYNLENKENENCIQLLSTLWTLIANQESNENKVSPIVYFILDNEIVPILRSSFGCISGSQLAIRVSGRWKEQGSTGDIDKEGNLMISNAVIHHSAFKDILSSLRIASLQKKGESLTIFVKGKSRFFIDEALDYFGIPASFILKVSD
jgi:hypothetical protein